MQFHQFQIPDHHIHHPLVQELRELFESAADSDIALGQAAYMKNHFAFYGIKKPVRAQVQKDCFKKHKIQSENELKSIIELLWSYPQREMQYAALDLAAAYHKLWTPQSLNFLETLICTKSWWDSVDALAANILGKIIFKQPSLQNHMDSWIKDNNMWKRRTAIIHQLRFKGKTDVERLFSYSKLTMHENEFFIRKAIGWALREYSKTNPEAVKAFLAIHEKTLSVLSKKEASKYL